jgi:BirA family transcriptional regulator, biotin operon repressor / biotin---[acetyl-CoA-carboxylase] ligase
MTGSNARQSVLARVAAVDSAPREAKGADARRGAGNPRRRSVQRTAPLPQRIYRILSDRQFHSGQLLATRCGVSRSAVWKAVAGLRVLGVTVHAVANRGYRLPLAAQLLDAQRIVKLLPVEVAARLRAGETCWCTGSTNTELLQRAPVAAGEFEFLAAEYQTAGRGRRTRRWYAPPGGSVCLSLSWCFGALPPNVGALSLAIGVCVLRALTVVGKLAIGLKWPNDLVVGVAKLGGILTEVRAEADGPALVVIGIGLNIALGPRLQEQLRASGAHGTDLAALGIDPCDRDRLTAALITECIEGLQQFERAGFAAFISDWRAADALAGKPVVVATAEGPVTGHARGIDIAGALCLQTRDGLRRFATGDVSVRATD